MPLNIPEHHKKIILKIGALHDEQVEELRSVLTTVDPLCEKDLRASVAERVARLDSDELKAIFETLSALYAVRARSEVSAPDFIEDISEALKTSGRSVIPEEGRIAKILEKLLDLPSLTTSSKVEALRRQHKYIFHEARIFTDLRPVFDSPKEPPTGFVITYALKIVFHDGPRHEEMYLALDAEDLSKIKATVERAEEKANTLRGVLSASALKAFGK